MKTPPTATQLAKLKAAAKRIARESNTIHSAALDQVAREAGYASWHDVTQLHKVAELEELPVDPKLPRAFDDTPNDERSAQQLAQWWLRPFARSLPDGQYEVRCLDGGAWDRSTWYGVASDLRAARQLAREKLAKWQSIRDTPISFIDEIFMLALAEDRPGLPLAVLEAAAHGRSKETFDRWEKLPEAEKARRIAAARARAAAAPTFDDLERLALTGRIQRLDADSPPAYGELAVCLLLWRWRWREPAARRVGCTLAEIGHYLTSITGRLQIEDAAELLRRASTCAVVSFRGTVTMRTPFFESYSVRPSDQDQAVLEFHGTLGAFPDFERKRRTATTSS